MTSFWSVKVSVTRPAHRGQGQGQGRRGHQDDEAADAPSPRQGPGEDDGGHEGAELRAARVGPEQTESEQHAGGQRGRGARADRPPVAGARQGAGDDQQEHHLAAVAQVMAEEAEGREAVAVGLGLAAADQVEARVVLEDAVAGGDQAGGQQQTEGSRDVARRPLARIGTPTSSSLSHISSPNLFQRTGPGADRTVAAAWTRK